MNEHNVKFRQKEKEKICETYDNIDSDSYLLSPIRLETQSFRYFFDLLNMPQ